MFNKPKLAMLLLASLLTSGTQTIAHAEETSSIKQKYEEYYNEKNGFISVSEAVRSFESKYKKKVEQPTKFPFKVTMQKAQLVPSPNQKGTALKIYYLGEQSNDSLIVYIINDYPLRNPLPIDQVIVLKDGTKAVYRKPRTFYFLEYQRENGLHYTLGISKHAKVKVSQDVMRQIANSMSH